MTCPCIAITRHQPGVYEWAVVFDNERLDGDVGEASIESCLSSASSGMPATVRLIEVCYRGVHMGTFAKARIEHEADEIAATIAETYGSLTLDN